MFSQLFTHAFVRGLEGGPFPNGTLPYHTTQTLFNHKMETCETAKRKSVYTNELAVCGTFDVSLLGTYLVRGQTEGREHAADAEVTVHCRIDHKRLRFSCAFMEEMCYNGFGLLSMEERLSSDRREEAHCEGIT